MKGYHDLNALWTLCFMALALSLGSTAMTSVSWANPVPIQVTQTSSPTFGSPITVSWTLKNTTKAPWNGSFIFNVDSNAVSALDQPNNTLIGAGVIKSGSFTFANPGPGSHWLSVTFIDTVSGGDPSKTDLPTQIQDGSTKPIPPIAQKPTGPDIQILASGTLKYQGSQSAGQIIGNTLSDAQKDLLLKSYAPLLLFSNDHGSEEKYAPIDVIDFIRASSLESQDKQIPSETNAELQMIFNIMAAPLAAIDASNQVAADLPRDIYLTPSSQAEAGTPWPQVITAAQAGNPVGIYGHVTLESVQTVTDNVTPVPPSTFSSVIQQELAGRYGCSTPSPCPAQIIKIEYWQFFGYSHDFENPAPPVTDLLGPDTSAILADLIDHSGDWCTVQIYVDASWAFSSRPDRAILAVYHSAHGLQFGFDMAQATSMGSQKTVEDFSINELPGPNYGRSVSMNFKAGETDSAVQAAQNNVVQLAKDPGSALFIHPVVYVEWGGHEFFPTTSWDYKYASKHNGTGKYHYIASGVRNVGEIGFPTAGFDQARLVTDFSGYWGNIGPGGQNGPPQGPPLHKQWFWDPNAKITSLRNGIKKMTF